MACSLRAWSLRSRKPADAPGALGLRFVASLCRVARHLALSWEQRNLLEPGRLRPTEHQIHILDGLAGRTFYQIVQRLNPEGAILDAIGHHADLYIVRAPHVLGLRQHALLRHVYERFAAIGPFE